MEKGKQYMNIESTVKPSQCTNRASGTSQTFANISKTNKQTIPLVLTRELRSRHLSLPATHSPRAVSLRHSD